MLHQPVLRIGVISAMPWTTPLANARGSVHGPPRYHKVCKKYNRFNGDYKYRADCRFQHVCLKCRKAHPVSRCKASRCGSSEAGPSSTARHIGPMIALSLISTHCVGLLDCQHLALILICYTLLSYCYIYELGYGKGSLQQHARGQG